MNLDQIEDKWQQFTAPVRARWGELSNNERYGLVKAEAEKQADEWSLALRHSGREDNPANRL
ncbi:MAG: general stress protein CsbD [Bryobacteraceae bacterium]|jgi:uncharacterized protein YjbJ (UPF0337 family)